MSNRVKLDTAIEREVHNLIFKIKEHTYDFVHLYVKRNNIPVDENQMKEILKIVEIGIRDGEMKQIDFFHEGIRSVLDTEFAAESGERKNEVPFTKEASESQSEKVEKFTFSL